MPRKAFSQLFQKSVTRQYPFEKAALPHDGRGRPVWDLKKCLGCGLCQTSCPSGTIELVGKGKTAEIKYHLDRCVFCAQCAEVCPVKAIEITQEFELATTDRSKMLHWYKREQEQPPAQSIAESK